MALLRLTLLVCMGFAFVGGCVGGGGGGGGGGGDGDGDSGDGDGDGPIGPCRDDQVTCAGRCSHTASDANNCGSCGNTCDEGELCALSECVTECPDGYAQCGDGCNDLDFDLGHCGSCDNACGMGEQCAYGECVTACPQGESPCGSGGACVNTRLNVDHCGACGNTCADGERCDDGDCVLDCTFQEIDCGGACANLSIDANNCGSCGNDCGAGLSCVNGFCQCDLGEEDCGFGCQDLLSDNLNCGFCGNTCFVDEVCSGGQCVVDCGNGLLGCNNVCTDVFGSDLNNCGGCGLSCPAGPPGTVASCDGGTCAYECAPNRGACDGAADDADGCEVDLNSDSLNCGGCGVECDIAEPCGSAICGGPQLTTWIGPRMNFDVSELNGWSLCYNDLYGDSGATLSGIQASCAGDQIMLACRQLGSSTITLAAHTSRVDAFTVSAGLLSNGSQWYYDLSRSWGFARGGDPLSLSSCDTQSLNPSERLCFHTSGSALNGGYRCGATTSLNSSVAWERLIYTSSP